MYRKHIGPTDAAGLGALLYALDGAHSPAVTNVAGRNLILGATGAYLPVLYWRADANIG